MKQLLCFVCPYSPNFSPSFPTANHSLSARANRVGLSVLKIWIQSKSSAPVADYISVVVGDVISPALDGLVIGDVVCLSSPLQTGASDIGHWTLGGATSSSALKLFSSGLAVAVRPGAESLYYVVGSNQYTLTDVKVASHSGVVLAALPSDAAPLSSVGGADSIVVDVILSGGNGLKSPLTPECKAELSHVAFPGPKFSFPTLFLCKLSFSSGGASSNGVSAQQLFSVAATFDADSGSHRCVVKARQLDDLDVLADASKIDSDVLLTVTSAIDEDLVVSDPVIIPYVAPLHLISPSSAEDPIVLTLGDSSSAGTILLSAPPSAASSVEATSTHPLIVAIEKEFGSDGLLKLSISVVEGADVDEELSALISIHSSLTGLCI